MSLRSRLLAATVAGVALASLSGAPSMAVSADGHLPANKFVKQAGDQFRLDGRPFSFGGTNNYYLMYSSHLMTDAVLDKAAANGLNVVRTWGWFERGLVTDTTSDGADKGVYFQYFDPTINGPAFNDGADGLQMLDYVVAKAKQDGIRLVLPLTGNWSAFGGMDMYTKWRQLQTGSAAGLTHSSFYTDPVIQGWYKNWINHLLNHTNALTGLKYKDDPTIMAWELANEPRCVGSGAYPKDPACNVDTLMGWVKSASRYVKSIDREHLVGTGSEGFMCLDKTLVDWTRNCNEGVNEPAFAALPTIDYLSFHLYPDSWGKDRGWSNQFILDELAAGARIHKPVVMGEYGWTNQATRNAVYQQWLDIFASHGGDGALYWILSDVQNDGTLYPDYDGFTVYCPSPVCLTISNYATRARTGQRSFPPVADVDTAKTEFDTPVTFDVTGNDIAYDSSIVTSTIDLDPATAGQQTTLAVTGGTFSAASDGTVTFTPTAGFVGHALATYTVRDSQGRTSNAAGINVTVKPSPTAPLPLFTFETGTEGWGVADANSTGTVSSSTVNVSQGARSLRIQSAGGYWFGAQFNAPINLTGRTTIRYDITATTGTNMHLVLKTGPSWEWCEMSAPGYATTPYVGDADMGAGGAVTIDLTTLTGTCAANIGEVHALYISVNGGSDTYVDNFRAY